MSTPYPAWLHHASCGSRRASAAASDRPLPLRLRGTRPAGIHAWGEPGSRQACRMDPRHGGAQIRFGQNVFLAARLRRRSSLHEPWAKHVPRPSAASLHHASTDCYSPVYLHDTSRLVSCQPGEEPQMTSYPDKSTANWVLGLASGTGVLVALDTLIVSTALTTIRRQLGASVADLEWTVNAYVLSFAVLLMTGAALGDRFGRKRMFASGLALFAVASAACALSDSAGWLIAARALQGAGAALMAPLALALLSTAFPPQARAKALGIFGGVVAFGIVLGPLVGGAVVEGISWRYAFWINVPIGLALTVLAVRRVPESHGPDPSIDLLGLALVTGAAFGIVWALVRGNSVGWGSSEVVVSLAAGVLLAGAFVGWELRVSKPMLPIRLFRARPFASGNTSMFFFWGAALASVFFLAASLACLGLIAKPDLPYGEFVVPLVLLGFGAALCLPATQSAVMSHVAPQLIGKASGTFTTLRQLGGAMGVAVSVAIFGVAGSYASPQAFSDGFGAAMGVAAGLAFAGAIAGLFAPSGRTQPAPAQPSPTPKQAESPTPSEKA